MRRAKSLCRPVFVAGMFVCLALIPTSPAGAQPIQDGTYLEHVDGDGRHDPAQQKYWPLAAGFAVLFLVLFAVYRYRQTPPKE